MSEHPINRRKPGRPKGSRNKRGKNLQEMIKRFLEENFEEAKACFFEMNPRSRAKLYVDLLPFVLPRQQATSLEAKIGAIASSPEYEEIILQLIHQHEQRLQQPAQPVKQLRYTQNREGQNGNADGDIEWEENNQ